MIMIDTYDGTSYTVPDLRREWITFRAEDPQNHADNFQTEFHEILMAAVNGRNDLDIIGLTPAEVSRFILRLRRHLNNNKTEEA